MEGLIMSPVEWAQKGSEPSHLSHHAHCGPSNPISARSPGHAGISTHLHAAEVRAGLGFPIPLG